MKFTRVCWWGILLPLVIVSLSGLACAQETTNTDRKLGMDPYEILFAIQREKGNLEWLWKMLAIKPKLPAEGTPIVGDEPLWNADCRRIGCKADIVSTEDLLDEAGYDSTMRICFGSGVECRILLLHQSRNRWRLVDHLDILNYVRAIPPEVSIVASGDRRWMVLKSVGGAGTGVSQYHFSWYEVRGGNLTGILGISAHGHDVNYDPTREHSTRFLRYRRDQEAEYLEFALQVRWKTRLAEQLLWQEERSVTYRRETGQGEYKFGPQRSEVTEEYVEEIVAFDHFDLNKFLRLHQDRLLRMAVSGPDWQKSWLRSRLKDAAETPARTELLKALGSSQ